MVDVHDKEARSRNMSAIRSSGSKSERIVWSVLDNIGLAFEKNVKGLPATPDALIRGQKIAVLVQGCFWHGHQCYLFHIPDKRRDFWVNKINTNIKRDIRKLTELLNLGYRVLMVWECALRGKKKLVLSELGERIEEFVCSEQRLSQIDCDGIFPVPADQLQGVFALI